MTRPGPAPLHVLVTVDFPDSFLERVRAADPRVVLHHHPAGEDAAAPQAALAVAEVLYTNDVLPTPAMAPHLQWVQLDTSGIDHLRSSPLWDSGVTVTTLGGVSPGPLAEWVILMVLAHAHHLRETERLAAGHVWPSRAERWKRLMPRDLSRSTLGVIGYGRIGREVARLARALGMSVVAVRRDPAMAPVNHFGAAPHIDGVLESGPDGLHDVLGRSDYIALTVPLTPHTEGMIGAQEIAAMKRGAVLVNGSRGGVVDEDSLLTALDSGHVDMVASDVFAHEPLPAGHPFWSHPRSVVTPHVAGFAPNYLQTVGALFTGNVRRYLAGEPLLNVADRERGY